MNVSIRSDKLQQCTHRVLEMNTLAINLGTGGLLLGCLLRLGNLVGWDGGVGGVCGVGGSKACGNMDCGSGSRNRRGCICLLSGS